MGYWIPAFAGMTDSDSDGWQHIAPKESEFLMRAFKLGGYMACLRCETA